MTKEQFENGMMKLTMLYGTFEFDVQPSDSYNKMKYKLWKDELDVISDFEYVVNYYVKTQDYPPQSPRSILKVYEEISKTVKGVLSPEQAWEIVRDRLSRYGLVGYYNSYQVYKNDFYDSIDDDNIKKSCKEMESALRDMTKESSSYLFHEFKSIYNRHVENQSKEDVLKIDSKKVLKIENN